MNFGLLSMCLLWATANTLTTKLEWEHFKKKYDKSYIDVTEEQYRFEVYLRNKKYIESHNAKAKLGQHNFTLAMNKLGDMTSLEYSTLISERNQIPHRPKNTPVAQRLTDVPDSIDWRTKGKVTNVKNQGNCSCSWAFSAAGAIEALKSTGPLVSLSVQNLMDCSLDYGTFGCNGGLPYQAFQYVIDNDGIDTEAYYPYTAELGLCVYSSNPANVGGYCYTYVDVLEGDENDLKTACGNNGPVSAVIDASLDSFRFYGSGVYYDSACNPYNLNQAVLVVGYGTDNGNYWIVKNSWGTDWGDEGYILMARNQGNMCGIANEANYPLF